MNRLITLITLISSMSVISGCAINQQVERAELSKDARVCIVENKDVRHGFLDELERVLQDKGIDYIVTDRSYANQNCEWSATYVARWSWDLALYMAYAEIRVYKNGVLDGSAVYDSTGGSANLSKFIDAEEKIRELVEELMQRES